MELQDWLNHTQTGEFVFTILVSMLPVVELRGGIPFGVAAGLPLPAAFAAAFIGNILPVPFLVLFTRRVLAYLYHHIQFLRRGLAWLGRKADDKKEVVLRYRTLGLFILVAIPLPGTGAWTGCLVAAALNMRLKNAVPAIVGGVLAAGIIISFLTYGFTIL